MTRFHAWSRRRLVASSLIAVGVAALAGTALAGHIGSGVQSYTGCLVPGDGVIIKVREGDVPKSACTGGQTQVHLSGGDITKISVTGGLTGGGDNGEVTIGLRPELTLPSSCSAGQVAKWNGTGWVCAADSDTTYGSGTGLQLSGTQFSVAPDYRVKNTPDCPSGQFATGFSSAGDIQCAAAPASRPLSYIRKQIGTITVVDNYTAIEIVRLDLPAGKYAVSASGNIEADTRDGWADGNCTLGDPGGELADWQNFADDDAHTSAAAVSLATVSLNGVLTLSAAGSVVLECRAFSATDQALANHFEIVAIAVG